MGRKYTHTGLVERMETDLRDIKNMFFAEIKNLQVKVNNTWDFMKYWTSHDG